MGGGMSIEQKNNQTIKNNISQEAISRCVIAQSSTQDINLTLTGGSITDSSFQNGVISNSASCSLKSSLQSQLINDLKSQQGATQVDVPGPFTVLSDLLGSKDNISQDNSQLISNQATQAINSLCQNNQVSNQNINIVAVDETIDGVTFGNFVKSNKFDCTIDNLSSFIAQNSESNSQVATQVRIDSIVFIALIIAVGVIAVTAIKYGFKKRSLKQKDNTLEEEKAILDAPDPYLNQKTKTDLPSPSLKSQKPPVTNNPLFSRNLS